MLAGPAGAQVQEGMVGAPAPARKVAEAVRIPDGAVQIDGRLDDPVWRSARFFSDFLDKDPMEGATPSVRTEVAIVFDNDAVYVGARMYENPADIEANVGRRDNGGNSEHLWVSFDTYHDRRTAYSFGLTAAGGRLDRYHPSDREEPADDSYDPVWEGKARIDSLGWTAEFRIPFSQLRFNARPEQIWGLNVDRWIPATHEDIYWIPVPKNVRAWSSRMGELRGIADIPPERRVELLPYVAGEATMTGAPDPANPFATSRSGTARVGGDLRLGLGPSITLQGTVNPDFGQVEADPADVNLSAFETYFDERRPFFTEGSQLLQGGGHNYFYSRRIGAAPKGEAGGDYVDRPNNSTILGAAKLTGRFASGFSLGALTAVTGREFARSYDIASNAFGDTLITPVTGYAVVRGRQEFGPAQSTVGGIVTAVRRDLTSGSALAQLLAREAYTGGGDFNLRFDQGTYELSGNVGASYVAGDPAAITALQESSARYYQRPDQNYVRVDSTRRSLVGYSSGLSLAKRNGDHWLWNMSVDATSPGLELNDAGRISSADGIGAEARLEYRETRPSAAFRDYSFQLHMPVEWNFGGMRRASATQLDADLTFANYWHTSLSFRLHHPAEDDALTRGGPRVGTPLGWVAIGSLGNNYAAGTRLRGRVYYGRDQQGGVTYRLSGSVGIRPGTRWQLSIDPNYLREINPRQYVTTLDGGPAATYGSRYVFAYIDRSTLLAQVRLSYAFTPDLTLETYAEPFAASGHYYNYGELPAAGSRDLRLYSAANATPDSVIVTDGAATFGVPFGDFNVLSFRSNVVLRWQWRPGSTLYLVWQENRSGSTPVGDRIGAGSLFDTFSSPGDNFFAIKASYWLPVR